VWIVVVWIVVVWIVVVWIVVEIAARVDGHVTYITLYWLHTVCN
jgi:hypothetical protein